MEAALESFLRPVVVADVVDIAKHLNKNIWTIWSNKKLDLESVDLMKHRFLYD